MPYCYVEDMSIVAMSRVGAKAVRAHAVRCSGRNSAVYFGHFLGWGGVFMLLPFYFIFFAFSGGFLFGVTPSRWAIPVRKALLIIPADSGECA